MAHERQEQTQSTTTRAVINFRPFLFCALGFAFGVFLCGKIKFGGLTPFDFLFLGVFLFFALRPLRKKRLLAILLTVLFSAGIGVWTLSLYSARYENTAAAGEYRLSGTVTAVTVKDGYSIVVLSGLSLDGKETGGKCRIFLRSTEVELADELVMTAKVMPVSTEDFVNDDYTRSYFSKDIRYTANASAFEVTGKSKNPFLRLNAAIYRALLRGMGEETAGVAYALLTGNSGSMDDGLLSSVRRGGVAHIFAVSGLHIGILFGAVFFACRKLGKYRFLPALVVAGLYCAVCNFTVSSVRALVMCGSLGTLRSFGKKYDFLDGISLAALLILFFSPAQWFATGFRLSFGACLGLALFAGSFTRLFTRLKFPNFLSKYLSAMFAIDIFLFPILLDAFGYFSVWGMFLNLLIVPLTPVLFLTLLVCAAFALIIPPAAVFFLALPGGMLSILLLLFSIVDTSFIISGFVLGAGVVVWLVGCLLLSERINLSVKAKAIAAAVLICIMTAATLAENVVFFGCEIEVYSRNGETLALIHTHTENVLIIDGDISLSACKEFLLTKSGDLDMVVVLSDDEVTAINTAAFLGAEEIRACYEVETGLRKTKVAFGESFSCGKLKFNYKSGEKLTLLVEGLIVEFDFEGNSALDADLFVGGAPCRLKYFLNNGIIKTR